MAERHSTLRAQRRAQTQRTIQAHAIRLFTARGYDATTMNEIAEAAGVSPMTLYRHFPTKEDLVLTDRHGELIAEHLAASPAEGPLTHRIARALIAAATALTGDDAADDREFLLVRLQLMIATPALRARHLDNQYALQQAITSALHDDAADSDAADPDPADPDADFQAQAAASACLAALHTAMVRWAEDDGRSDLPHLIGRALAAVFGDEVVEPAR
ncbi:TetR/AcrR family transcriptional regulator [Nonomuraea candida]|uniref:TetR/AcrR family transcriptional regulator n=1 Tax=Nonomuraea candida TaxID=359159 RepID=UPI0005BA0CA2|nr:TetR/AcrR family transcriptional regulator [Nonomuraea candida]